VVVKDQKNRPVLAAMKTKYFLDRAGGRRFLG
jgi:hypothetical protein